MTYLPSQSMATDFAFDGIMNFDDLKIEDKRKLALQLFNEESDIGNQISMLIEGDAFQTIPHLILSTFNTKDPSPGNGVSNDLINRMIKDNFRDEVLSKCLKCLVQTYTPVMKELIHQATCDLEEENNGDDYDDNDDARHQAGLSMEFMS